MNDLKAVSLLCTLSPSPSKSSSQLLASQVETELAKYQVSSNQIRVVDHQVRFGVKADMGEGDQWPMIRQQVLEADIVIIATPIWMGQPSAVTKMVLERLNADQTETDEQDRPLMYGKVAIVAVVGNEDGAHHVSAEVYQALSDIGFTIPAGGPTYWVGEAMSSTDYQDLEETPAKTTETTEILARNAAHLAKLLKQSNYPAP